MVTSNLLLDSLSPGCRSSLLDRCTSVDLPLRTVLYPAEVEPRFAFFLTAGIASVVVSDREGQTVEVEVIGCEGLAGGIHLLGPAVGPAQCFMQLPGAALRIRLTDLHRLFLDSPETRSRTLEFVQIGALTLSQIAGCHRMHTAEQRLARWLLMIQDRVKLQSLALTQEFLAEMLGSQRTTVSAVASAFQKEGMIRYTRGHIHILDRLRLEEAACGCYPIVRDLLEGLYRLPPALDKLYSSSSIVLR